MTRKFLLVLTCALLTLAGTACGNTTDQQQMDGLSIITAYSDDQICRISLNKNYGGQETGVTCNIFLPLDENVDLEAVQLSLKLSKGIFLLDGSNCVVENDGGKLVVNMTVKKPYIVVGNPVTGWSRTYHLQKGMPGDKP